jgi:hypothetical protein
MYAALMRCNYILLRRLSTLYSAGVEWLWFSLLRLFITHIKEEGVYMKFILFFRAKEVIKLQLLAKIKKKRS